MTAAVAIEAIIEIIKEQIIRMTKGLAELGVTTGQAAALVFATLSLHSHFLLSVPAEFHLQEASVLQSMSVVLP